MAKRNLEPIFFRRGMEEAEIASSDGDSALFFHLMYLGEMLTKSVGASFCAGVMNDSDRHRYRNLYRLVHADGLGEWAKVIDEVLVGGTTHLLHAELQKERRELTMKVSPGEWQFEASSSLDACLRCLNPQRQGLPAKLDGKSWFVHFAELRNATRGHGALKANLCAQIIPHLQSSIILFIESFHLFKRQWAYLHRNLSGKFRVSRLTSDDNLFAPLKSKAPETWGQIPDGLYIFLDRPIRIDLIYTDPDLSDFFFPNGNFKSKHFETISYLTDIRRNESSVPYVDPATQLPISETQGILSLEARGEAFTNLPFVPRGYIRRPILEAKIGAIARDDRHPIVTLTGRGGIGKTSLALQILHDMTFEAQYGAILWFSSRDVDLQVSGPKPVRPHLLDEKDIGKEAKSLIGELIPIDEDQKPIEFLSDILFKSPLTQPIIFVFDNFETVSSPVELYTWIDTYVRSPNKVIITTRFREFRADYAIEVGGMEFGEAGQLIVDAGQQLGINHLLDQSAIEDLYQESDGHPYVIKMLLGEIAKQGRLSAIERIVASKDHILDALFERSYARLSPAAQQVFLTLSSWRSTIPKVALEAVLLRPSNERLDVEAALEELERSSFIEITQENEDNEPFLIVPLSAALFGRKRLQTSPLKLSTEANMELLLFFGTGQRAELHRGIGPRMEKFFRKVALNISTGKSSLEQYLPILEYLSHRYAKGWLLLSELYEERTTPEAWLAALDATRRFVESANGDEINLHIGWKNLARLARLSDDVSAELQAMSELAILANAEFSEISDAINRFNQISKNGQALPSDERQMLAIKLQRIADARRAEANATDLSRIAWLFLSTGDEEKAREFVGRGLRIEPDNFYCLRIAERKGWN